MSEIRNRRSVNASPDGIMMIRNQMSRLRKREISESDNKRSWTIEYLANEAEISKDTVKRFLKGIAIDLASAIAISDALCLDLEELIEKEEVDKRDKRDIDPKVKQRLTDKFSNEQKQLLLKTFGIDLFDDDD